MWPVFPLESKKIMYTYILTRNFGYKLMLTAIMQKNVDASYIFHGRKTAIWALAETLRMAKWFIIIYYYHVIKSGAET